MGQNWEQAAYVAVIDAAQTYEEFSTDEVWDLLGDGSSVDHRRMGAVIRRAQADAIIGATSRFIISRRLVNHGRPVRVWRSQLA